MIEKGKYFLERILKKRPDVWFFYGFLITFTLTIRKVIDFYPIKGEFNEFTGIYIYLSDLFLIATIIIWIFTILCNNSRCLSINKLFLLKKVTFWLKWINPISNPIVILPLLLVIWSFLSVIWSNNTEIALFRSIKLLEFYLLYLYIRYNFNVPRGTLGENKNIENCSTWNNNKVFGNILKIIIFIGLFNAILAIIQFINKGSLGLRFLKESIFNPDMAGVAKITLGSNLFVRPYGLFPHPNILGAFLLFSIIIVFIYFKLTAESKCSTRLDSRRREAGVEHLYWSKVLFYLILTILLLSLFLTFSKTAFIGLLVVFIFISYSSFLIKNNQTQLRLNNIKLFLKEKLTNKRNLLLIAIFIMLFINLRPSIESFFSTSFNDRLIFQNVSRGTISENLITGVGMGQFVPSMDQYSIMPLLKWQYQPVHNVFSLIWSELGLIGLIIFVCFLLAILKNFKSISNKHPLFYIKTAFRGLLIAFILMMLFDHYFWDIQQAQVLFWMVLALV